MSNYIKIFQKAKQNKQKHKEKKYDNLDLKSDNFQELVKWQYQHQLSYWKSRVKILEDENRMLHEHIQSIYKHGVFTLPYSTLTATDSSSEKNIKWKNFRTMRKKIFLKKIKSNDTIDSTDSKNHQKIKKEDNVDADNVDANNVDPDNVELDEEWLKFAEQTERHRVAYRQEIGIEQKNELDEPKCCLVKQESFDSCMNKDVMKEMYGDGAPKIMALEIAMQLVFDHHTNLKKIPYWPTIPLKF